MEAAVSERLDRIEDLLAQIIRGNGVFRAEMHEMCDGLRAEMHEMNDKLRTEMHELHDKLRTEMHELHDKLRVEMRSDLLAVEKRLEKAIEAVQIDLTDYMRDNSYHEKQLSTRLTRVENRVAELEKEYRAKEPKEQRE